MASEGRTTVRPYSRQPKKPLIAWLPILLVPFPRGIGWDTSASKLAHPLQSLTEMTVGFREPINRFCGTTRIEPPRGLSMSAIKKNAIDTATGTIKNVRVGAGGVDLFDVGRIRNLGSDG